tara:strand:- start:1722 stop:3500 length:1779 start_codon:yes stop_codon:yes gene_type:complete
VKLSSYDLDPETKINWRVFSLITPFLVEHRIRIGFALICLVASKGASVSAPFVLKHIIDDLSKDGVSDLLLVPLALIVAYGFARFSMILLGEIRDTIFGRVTERAMRKIGLKVFKHLHNLDLEFHLERRTGGLSRDIERGINGISFLMRFFVFNIVPTLLEIFLVAGLLFYNYGAPFAVIILLAVMAYISFSLATTDWRTQFVRQTAKADSKANTICVESLLNYETVKYFSNEDYEAQRYDNSLERWESAKRKDRLSLLGLNSGQALIIAIAMVLLMWLAAERVRDETMTIGDFVLVNAFMVQLFMPLNFLGFVYREIKGWSANIENMFALLAVEPKLDLNTNASDLELTRGVVSFDGVSFSYNKNRPILREINFSMMPGQQTAIVGASGVGKSTLIKLLFRFYDPDSGRILIDNQDIKKVNIDSLRRVVGIVPQDAVLFNDTILENIRYGCPDASEKDVSQAIDLAHLKDFIASLPEGLGTIVGERGLKLSGGEKQRVTIARTILKNPTIIIFDEATSSLDSKSESMISAALRDISKNRTCIVIAHRLSTIVNADKILVLKDGFVSENGTHSQLLALKGHYHELWKIQARQ